MGYCWRSWMPVLPSPLIWFYQSVSQNSVAVMLNHTTWSASAHMSGICICMAWLNDYHCDPWLHAHRHTHANKQIPRTFIVGLLTCFTVKLHMSRQFFRKRCLHARVCSMGSFLKHEYLPATYRKKIKFTSHSVVHHYHLILPAFDWWLILLLYPGVFLEYSEEPTML